MTRGSIVLHVMPHGTARFFRQLDGDLGVSLNLRGVTPGSLHTVDLGTTTVAIAVELPAVQADAAGQIQETIHTRIPTRLLRRDRGVLTVLQGVVDSGSSARSDPLAAQVLARAKVPLHVGNRGQRRALRPGSDSGMPLRGSATYTFNARDPGSKTGYSVP